MLFIFFNVKTKLVHITRMEKVGFSIDMYVLRKIIYKYMICLRGCIHGRSTCFYETDRYGRTSHRGHGGTDHRIICAPKDNFFEFYESATVLFWRMPPYCFRNFKPHT